MRVSTSQMYSIANIGMRDAQVAVDKTQQQITSGKRVLSAADDPVAATSILTIHQEVSRTEQYNKNIDAADNSLGLEETTLQTVMSLVQRLKELSVSAGNTAVLTKSDYQAMAAEVDSRMDELMNLQNTRNSSGQYIFAGFQSGTQPFVNDGGGKYSYQGDEGQLRLQSSTTVSVAVNDSGKKVFMDIPSSHNTFNTIASPSNKSSPPAIISVGEVVDQETYDKIFPQDMVVTFNTATDYTVTERTTGKIIAANQTFVPGQPLEVQGARFSIYGAPFPGTPATPATRPFTFGSAATFSAAPEPLTISVGGVSETFYLDRDVNNASDLAAALSSATENVPGSGAGRNASKLANLGLTVTAAGLVSANGLNITISGGSANTDNVTGLATTGTGSSSSDGVTAKPGDSFVIEATDKQGLLTTVSRFSEAMKNVKDTEESKNELAKLVSQTLANLENSITNIASVQGEIGARQNMLESSKTSNSDILLTSQEVLSQLEDLDYAEASTRLQMQSFVLSAAQQTFVKVSELSLFKYM